MNAKTCWFFLLFGLIAFACNTPKKQQKINDRKLVERLAEKKGYLNALDLKRLKQDFSLNLLETYDLSGFDEQDTLAYFVRSGEYVWIASCYLDEEASNPFFCLKDTGAKKFQLVQHGTIPSIDGECSYQLNKLLIPVNQYILVAQKSSGSAFCDESPLIFHRDGKAVYRDEQFRIITRNCPDDTKAICFERDFDFALDKSNHLLVSVREKGMNWETEREISGRSFILRFTLENNRVRFSDTIFQ